MNVRAVVDGLHSSFDTSAAMADIAALCAFDRYQASSGIMAAARYVAGRAEAAGCGEVRLLEFPADGSRRWWTFRAPTSWTPVLGELSAVAPGPVPSSTGPAPFSPIGCADRSFTLAAYPAEPFTLAAHSAPTDPVEVPVVRVGQAASLHGALAVHDDPLIPLPAALAQAEREGALGLVTDQVSGDGRIGRVELRAGTTLLAFSLAPGRPAELLARGRARLTVTAHATAPMPVVTALLPGEDAAGEILLYAHLCHPMPSANDNASGVAALLGTARALAGTRRRRGVRLVWGPEFTGMAAYLHDIAAAPPMAAVNVDMAGEDQRLCGGPLIVERAPDHLPGFVSALAEHVVTLLPQAARSYTGAVPCDTWAWRATPFAGASDHSLLADRSVGCPAVTLGHWPDRFNHSSADTVDKVDPRELRRTATIAAATVAVLSAATVADRPVLEAMATRWAAARLLECLPDPAAGPDRAPHPVESLRHRTRVALAALTWIDELCGDRGGTGSGRWIETLSGHIATLLPAPPPEPPDGGRTVRSPALRRAWPGPFNLRGLAEAGGPRGAEWIAARLTRDRGRAHALMLALAHGIDGVRDRRAVTRYAELSSGLPVDGDLARGFLDLLVEAGWAVEATTAEGGADAPPHA